MSAFAGLRVLDFSQGVAGPMAAMYLADFGAEVAKLEPPGGDRLKDHPGYHAWNRNKQRCTLDLAADADAARALIAAADVAIFDQAPGDLERLGLDGAALTEAFPRLVHLWTPPYGTSGAWSRLPPDHALLTAVTGTAFRQTTYQDQPAWIVSPQAWYAQGATAAAAVAAALYERSKSGRGQAVTVSGLHGLAQVNGSTTFMGAVEGAGVGLPHGSGPNYRCFRCADGKWLFFGALFPPMRMRALAAIGLEDLINAPGIWGDWANVGFPEGYAVATWALETRFAEQPREVWLNALLAADVPCAPVEDRDAWFAGPTVAADGMRVELDHPALGRVAVPGVPVRLSATPGAVRALAKDAPPPAWTPSEPSAAHEPQPSAPLAGIRVLDLGTVIAGAYTGCMLASLGAEVIKIEPAEGDPFRVYGALFLNYNRGKRSLAIDLKRPEGREAFLDLVRAADVVTDNARPGVRARLGLDYAALRAVNPRIISCSISAYAHDGDRAHRPGFDPLLQAEAGFMAAQGGGEGGEPVYHQIAINDVASSVTAVFGILAALNVRERTGEGQEVTTSLAHQSVMFQSGEIVAYEGRPPAPVGGPDFLGPSADRRFYECADGWIAVACQDEAQARALHGAFGADADSLERAFARIRRGEALARLAQIGVPAIPALRPVEAYRERWLWENGFFEAYRHPLVGQTIGPSGYAAFARSACSFTHPAPGLGEHTAEVLRDFGFPNDRIEALIEVGAVAQG